MTEPTPDPRKRYEKLMRGAGARRRAIAARTLENERLFRREMQRLQQQRTTEERTERVARDLRTHAEQLHMEARIKHELAELKLKLAAATETEERILLKAEIAHLETLKTNLGHRLRRKPPESGIAIPAIPPSGPLPKQGGAEAPLDFDA